MTTDKTFNRIAARAVFFISLFVLTYFLLIAITSVSVTAAALWGYRNGIYGIPIVNVLLVAFIIVCLFALFFLLKFMFTVKRANRYDLIEITAADQPELFAFIGEIVDEVKTPFPKKVYVSPGVDAYVFYDSSFWSMFFRVRKNLAIGIGLVNSVTKSEFKSILAHEFGHFSQRSMKVGSYVHHLNRVIYNMLDTNESLNPVVTKLKNSDSYWAFVSLLPFSTVKGMQAIMKSMYKLVNVSYLRLSREMEFHADEIAASVAGTEPMSASLLRTSFSDHVFEMVLNYYNNKIESATVAKNVYPQHLLLMNFMAGENRLEVIDGLPQVRKEDIGRYNKSKLIVTAQWESHPSVHSRIERLENMDIKVAAYDRTPASEIFADIETLEKQASLFLFSTVNYSSVINYKDAETFLEEFIAEYREATFHTQYNDYYNHKNPDPDNLLKENPAAVTPFSELFSNEKVDLVYTAFALKNDLDVIRQISSGKTDIKTFDYDGKKYLAKRCAELISELEKELKRLNELIAENDGNISRYYMYAAEQKGVKDEYIALCQNLIAEDKAYDRTFEIHQKVVSATEFLNQVTTYENISKHLMRLKDLEFDFKQSLRRMIDHSMCRIDEVQKETIEQYLEKEHTYFSGMVYIDAELELLMCAIQITPLLASDIYADTKKEFLKYQVELTPEI